MARKLHTASRLPEAPVFLFLILFLKRKRKEKKRKKLFSKNKFKESYIHNHYKIANFIGRQYINIKSS